MNCTRLIPRSTIINARPGSNGSEDIGLNSGSSTTSPLLNMLRRMLSSARGAIFYTRICNPSRSLKLLPKASILAWSEDLSQKMPTHRLLYGVMMTISSSATFSSQRSQLPRTGRSSDSTSTLVHLLQGRMAHMTPIPMSSAPSIASMGSSPILLLKGQR